ncbi:GTPase-associated protein 1-related protein [Micromonospora sp. DT229]|uniref:GTPase-associated protein 1-related protein n=1 Tax=Micromonospora sp. DT229 TaxID=3393430 RepID=UPI003CE91332
MTGDDGGIAFDTLIYTDCLPGQGLQGSAGLQFQARSEGAGREAMSLMQRHLLYEPPSKWMRERRPVEEYPDSLAHTWDGLLATAAGRYLGREANGGREGNQLTHGIVTTDPADYGEVRPAQLFGAPFWTGTPAPTTDCPPVPVGWTPGPITVPAVQEFVRDTPRGVELLVALLSTLHRLDEPDGRRVLFIAEDPGLVLRWIAAATLLLPQRRALAVGFKVFTTNPAYASQQVVAVHPDWDSTSSSVENDSGYAVFDLVRHVWSEVPVTAEADQLARLFVEQDPYDVVDLVEVAAETGLPADRALVLAGAMILPATDLPLATARLAVSWLRDSGPDLLPNHRGLLVDQLVRSIERWPQDVLLSLDEVAGTGQVPDDRVAPVRLALIRAELDHAAHYGEVTGARLAVLAPGVWSAEQRQLAEDLVVDALRGGLRPVGVDAVLRVATRFGLTVRLGEVEDAVHEFVVDWADHPERNYDIDLWSCGVALMDRLHDELYARIGAGRSNEVGDAWGHKMLPRPLITDLPLDEVLLAARMRRGDTVAREKLVRKHLGEVIGTEQADEAIRRTVAAFWQRVEPTLNELRLLCELLPPDVELDPQIFAGLAGRLDDGGQPLTTALLGVARKLIHHGLWRPPARAVVHRLLLLDAEVREACGELPHASDPRRYRHFEQRLTGAGERVLALRRDEVIQALLQVRRPEWLPHTLQSLPPVIMDGYCVRLIENVRKGADPWYVVLAFYLLHTRQVPAVHRERLSSGVQGWTTTASERRLKAAASRLAEIDPAVAERWAAMQNQARSTWLRRTLRRGGG